MNRPDRPDRPVPPAHRARHDLSVFIWPLGLMLLLALLAAWRVESRAAPGADDRAAAVISDVVERRGGLARIDVPHTWVRLDRASDHATWGAADRTHTVTVAHVESTSAPLPAVVTAVAADAASVLPGARVVARPIELDLRDAAPRGDSAMLLRLLVEPADGPQLHVVQVWRRDSRAGVDLVATWTSTDGRWPRSPRRSIPRADASR